MRILRISLLVLVIILFPLESYPAKAGGPSSLPRIIEKKTMSRVVDYVTVQGKQLPSNLNKVIKNMSLFAFVDGKGAPIPFQIDERDSEDDWVLTMVPPSLQGKSVKPQEDDDKGRLDGNDELVFMARDSGSRIREGYFPPGAVAVDEIELTDPIDGGKSWVYLYSFTQDPPLSDRSYVKYIIEQDRITSDTIDVGFPPSLPIAPGFISIHGRENILDQMKVRASAEILFIPVSLDESCFLSELSYYQTGPVRIIRRTSNAVKVTRLIRTPAAMVENLYYDRMIVIPIKVKLPFSVKFFKRIIKFIKVRGSADMQNLHGWRIRFDFSPQWFSIDGKMDAEEEEIAGEDVKWFLVSRNSDAFILRLVLDRGPDGSYREVPITSSLYYVDGDDRPDPPEFIPGQSPNVGFWLNNLRELEKGFFYCFPIFFAIDDYREGAEVEYMNSIDRSIKVRVNKK